MDSVVRNDRQVIGAGYKEKKQDDRLVPPCQDACPLKMDIREYVDLVAQGKVMEALQVIRDGNPFPSICAHVCTHPCEDNCRRTQVDSPIAIRSLKRFAVEFGGDRMVQAEAETKYSEKVAIVGSGPAGLSCAYYLRTLGYTVTIFEAHTEVGGMLRVGIPQYRLPREVLDTEVYRLNQIGVEIRTNTRVVSLDVLFELGYKAIFITIGAHQSLKMGIEGEESPGVIDGATFLREVNLGLHPIPGDSVAVVGGGNVAIDAARTAARLGAKKVTILYRRSNKEMPADPEEVKQALEEKIRIQYLTTPTRITRNEGKLHLTCTKMKLGEPDTSGRRQPVPVEGSENEKVYDSVIIATGQAPQAPGDFGVSIGRGSTIQVDPVTLTTNRRGVFAGGDAVTGPATVTEALAAGRMAAHRIDDFLQHRYPTTPKDEQGKVNTELKPETINAIRTIGRSEPQIITPELRTKDFQPIEQSYGWEEAINEARRCLRCGIGAEILFQDKCATCLTCFRVCPYNVPYLDEYGTINIPADQCQACGICVAECPANAIILRNTREIKLIDEELDHVFRSAAESNRESLMIGFCCQYGLFGTGTLAGLWRGTKAGVWIVPVLCIAKVEPSHLLRAFESGAEGVFIAGCGDQCARENTASQVSKRVNKVKGVLESIGIEPERLKLFIPGTVDSDPVTEINEAFEEISGSYLASIIKQEVRD
ncbi:MAG: FAD-dependent oxidoreductase [Dehalococcoidales bacterium]|nr:MAG: FAD-dependent oxidoreductase [Dehalococcoidales bacterium]